MLRPYPNSKRRPCKAIGFDVSSCWRERAMIWKYPAKDKPGAKPPWQWPGDLRQVLNNTFCGTSCMEKRMARCVVSQGWTNRRQFHQLVQPIQLQKCCNRVNHRMGQIHQTVYLEWFYLAVPDNILSSEKNNTTHRFINHCRRISQRQGTVRALSSPTPLLWASLGLLLPKAVTWASPKNQCLDKPSTKLGGLQIPC